MEKYILALLLFSSVELASGKVLQIPNDTLSIADSTNAISRIIDSLTAMQLDDSCSFKQTTDTTNKVFREIRVNVTPDEVSDASIMIIQKGIIDAQPAYTTTNYIKPDTIGVWKAPLSLCLSTGLYDIVSSKEEYKNTVKKIEINSKRKYTVTMDMVTLEYLRNKREQWAAYKLISAAVAVGSGAATLYFKNRIDKYKNDYNNAISPDIIRGSRERIRTSQSNYTTFSAIMISALSSVTITWYVESLYNE